MSSANTHPRRTPRQDRSRLMVDRILAAAQNVLIARGYEGSTTNSIAKEAEISPGSLYQYFPNKDAIIAAVVGNYTDQIVRVVTSHLIGQVGRLDDPQMARETLAVLLDAMSAEPELLRAMIEHTPRLGLGNKIVDFERSVGELAIAHLQLSARPVRRPDTFVWITVRAVEHLMIRYVLDRPDIDRDEFLDELTAMFGRYAEPR